MDLNQTYIIQQFKSVMLFFHAFKEKNIKIDLASQYIKLTLFWAITYAIAEIYYTIKPYQEQSRGQSFFCIKLECRMIRNIFLGNILNLAIFLTLGLFGIPQYKCESRYSKDYTILQWIECQNTKQQINRFSMVLRQYLADIYYDSLHSLQQKINQVNCQYFYQDINFNLCQTLVIPDYYHSLNIKFINIELKYIREIRIEEVEEKNDNKLRIKIHLDNTDQLYYQERVNQIKMVIFTLILCSLIDLLLDLIIQLLWNIDYYSETALGQVTSFFKFLLQAIPSITIPYIFYVLPIRNRSKENIDLKYPMQEEKKEQKHLFVEDSEDEEEQQQIILTKSEQIIGDVACSDPAACTHKHKLKKSKSWFQAADDLRKLKKKIICKQCDIQNNNCESECGSDTCIKKDKLDTLDFAHQKIKSGGFSKSFTDKYQQKESHVHDDCD